MKSISVLDQICLCGVIPILVPHDLDPVGAVGAALTGIDAANAPAYLSQPFVAAIGGSWMLPHQHIREGHFDVITRLTAGAVRAVSQARS